MNKIFTLLLALVATTTLWAHDFEVNGIFYKFLEGNDVEVTYKGSYNNYEYLGAVTIPETVTYNGTTYSVTSIGDKAFYFCESLTSITIPNSVTSIGEEAFYRCSSLTSITIPNSVTSIGDKVFLECYSLTSITIPNSVTSIGDKAFYYCSSLTSVTIGNSVTSIGEEAFEKTGIYDDESNWENNVFYIDNYLIKAKTSISGSYTVKENTRSIADYAFYGCRSLTSVTIPNSVTSIGEDTFAGCSSLTSVTIGNSVTSIGDRAFQYCSSLTSVTIGNSVTSIGDGAFLGCRSLTSITIPNSVTSIGDKAFYYCSSLTSIVVESGNTTYDSRENCNAIIETATNTLIAGCQNTIIPNSVTSIGDVAFAGCEFLTSITIPNSVTSIGSSAFSDCESLTSIVVESGNTTYDSRENCNAIIETATNTLIAGCQNTIIPNSVTSIEDRAFQYCSSLTSITIPNSVTSIGEEAFYRCSSLTSITIPNSVMSIGDKAFLECSSLTSVTIGNNVTSIGAKAFEGTGIYDDESNWENNVFYIDNYLIKAKYSISGSYTVKENTRSIADYAFLECSSLTSLTIPNSVTSIGDKAFYDCSSLTSLTIPNSVTSIGYGAFYVCSSLTSITIPNSVTSIGDKAFLGCRSLTSITIPNSVTSIGDGTFSGCESLTSVTIPNSVTSIGDVAFAGCEFLTSITIPNSVTSIGDGAFYDCSSLTSITIHSSVTSIGNSAFEKTGIYDDESNWENNVFYIDNYLIKAKTSISGPYTVKENTRSIADYAFSSCESLTSVTIPNSVTSIGDKAFLGCRSLTSITIPNSVTSIGDGTFSGCESLTSVTIPNSVTSIGDVAFAGCEFLTSITIPNSITSIGDGAFYDCSSLTSITIPSSVTSIGDTVFTSNLTSIVITAESIEEYCQSIVNELLYSKGIDLPRKLLIAGQELTELVIPCTVNTITEHTFKGLDFKSISISANTIEEYFSSSINQLLYDKGIQLPRKLMIAGKKANELVIPCTLTHIADNTFKGLDYNSITISANSVEEYFSSSINQLLYDKGIQLPRKLMIAGKKANELIIPCTLTHIADNTFKGLDYNSITISANSVEEYCNSSINQLIYHKGVQLPRKLMIAGKEVTELVISEGVTEIKEEAFRGMQNIAVVTIPTSVNHIAKNAFVGTALYDNKANWVEGALYIGDCLIYVNTPLEKYNITEGTRLIADAAFEVCEGLTAVKLPRKSLLYIGTNAFSNCSLIKSVNLPKTVTSVGENAFSENTSVK